MAEISKQALKVDNNTSFPNNNNGAITPSILRAFNTNMIDSMVDEIGYNVDSASWNQQIDSLEQFTASLSTTFVTTGSFNTYTSSINSKFSDLQTTTASMQNSISALNAYTASDNSAITNLNAFTASQLTINTGYNTFTQSANTQLTNLSTSQSIDNTKWNTLGTQSGSWVTSAITASSLITASFSGQTLTFTKGDASTFGIVIPDVSGSDITALNAFTASQLTINTGYNTFTQSAQQSINSLNAATASYAISSSVAAVDAAQQSQINSLISATGSYVTESETASFARTNVDNNFSVNQTFTNITAVSASFQYVQTTYETASVIYSSGSNQFGDELSDIQTLSGSVRVQGSLTVNGTPVQTSSVDITSLNAFTASQETKNSTLATYTASVDSSLTNINSFTASNSNTSLNSYTASNDTKWSNLAGQTGSYVTSAITASSLVTASVNLNTITFTKGDASTFNITVNTGSGGGGTDITSLNAFTASQETKDTTLASVTSSLNTATASLFTSASLALVTASFAGNTLTFTKGDTTTFGVVIPDVSGSAGTTIYEVVYTGESITKGDPLYISGSQGANPRVFKADAADPNKMPVTFVSNETIGVSNTTNAIVLGLIEGIDLTGYIAGQSIYVAEGGGWSASLPSGSNSVTQLLGVVTKGGSGGKGLVLNPGPAQLPGLDNGYMWVGGATNQPIEITTASFASSASFNTYTASNDQKVNSLISATGSYATTGSNTFNGDQTINNTSGFTNLALVNSTQSNITLDAPSNFFFAKGNLSINNYGNFGGSGSVNITATSNSINLGADNGLIIGRTIGGSPNGDGAVKMNTISGSLVLAASTYNNTAATLLHLSSSSNTTFVNLIFKNNNAAADTIISGSNNIFTNPNAPTAGFKRYIGGSNNFINSGNTPQISGSMAFSPNLTGNYIGGTPQLNMRGPVSSSAWSISNNIINANVNIGSTATNNAEKVVSGLSISSNMFNNSLTVTANRSLLTQPLTISNNHFAAGPTTLTPASSSIIYSSNLGGGIAVTNAASGGLVAVDANAINLLYNVFGGLSNTITATGSQDTGDTSGTSYLRHFEYNQIFGTQNGVNLPYAETGSNSLNATMIAGYSLGVTGSNASSFTSVPVKNGSAFFGRYNAQDGNKAQSAQTVFAVGTGDSTTRKTGFLIDSGSNTFIEGTLNVSGSTTMTGSLILSSSNAIELQVIGNSVFTGSVAGNVVSASITSNTASIDFSLGNYFEVTSSVTPLHLNVTNIGAGRTSTLIISASASSSILFSPNVAQPSGSAYSGSLGSIDILSLVAFNSSKINVVATKALV